MVILAVAPDTPRRNGMADDQADLIAYRYERFMEMGFESDIAMSLARMRDDSGWPINTHRVEDMLKAGCTHPLLYEILR